MQLRMIKTFKTLPVLSSRMKFSALFLTVVTIFGCSSVGKIAYGYKDLSYANDRDLQRWSERMNKNNVCLVGHLDSVYIREYVKISQNPVFRKAMAQFIVVMAFRNDQCRSITSSCYFGGFPNLRWDNGTFNQFPFVGAVNDTICEKIRLSELLGWANLNLSDSIVHKETIVVLSGNTLIRQSRRLIETLMKQYPDKSLILVNNDNSLYYLYDNLNLIKV